jgi:hypothetical protein
LGNDNAKHQGYHAHSSYESIKKHKKPRLMMSCSEGFIQAFVIVCVEDYGERNEGINVIMRDTNEV